MFVQQSSKKNELYIKSSLEAWTDDPNITLWRLCWSFVIPTLEQKNKNKKRRRRLLLLKLAHNPHSYYTKRRKNKKKDREAAILALLADSMGLGKGGRAK